MASSKAPASHEDLLPEGSGPTIRTPSRARPSITKQACDTCRRRKLKCDGETPTCSSCIRIGVSCQYLMGRGKSGPRKGHLKALYDRLANMEATVATAATKPVQNASASGSEQVSMNTEPSNLERLNLNNISSIGLQTAKVSRERCWRASLQGLVSSC